MSTTLIWIWVGFAILLGLAGIRRLISRRRRVRRTEPGIDDAAIARILAYGTLGVPDDDPLDENEIARAEAEFWDESWEEPEEYGR